MSQSKDHLYCQHLREFDQETFDDLFSEVAAVRAEDPALFDFTHRPITVFPSDEAGADDPRTITEEEILNGFSATRSKNYAVIIEGETGTGKSELCAYLVHRLREQHRPILRVQKDDDLMSILTKRLPEFHEEHFGESLPSKGEFEQLEEDIESVPHTVASNAVTGSLLTLTKTGFDLEYSESDEQEIIAVVEEQLAELVSHGEYGKQNNLISEQEYERNACLQVFAELIPPEDAVDEMNERLWSEIRDRYDTPPLSEVLKEVGRKFTDTRPVIVFEDFSIASVEANRLSEYIERDVKGDNWDFIIAGTRDVTQVLHTQTAEDRYRFYQTNKPNTSSVLFLDEDSCVDFIRPYLGYLKHATDRSVQYRQTSVDGETETLELLQPESDSICGRCGLCDESFRDLYPFNETFLQRIYTGLDESQQSPREYVSKVYEVLKEYHFGAVKVPSSSNALGSDVTNSEIPGDEVYEEAEAFADLAKWYGIQKDGHYSVDRAFTTAFGLLTAQSDEPEVEYGPGIEADGSEVRIPAAAGGGRGGGDGGEGGRGGTSKEEQIYNARVGDVDDWINDPTNTRFSETNDYIRTALESLINHVTEDYRLWTGCSLRYNVSSQQAPFVYRDTAARPSASQIVLSPKEFRPSEVRKLLRYGINLGVNRQNADTEEMLESFGTQITDYGERWRQSVIEATVETPKALYRKADRGRFDFDDFLLASYALLVLLDDPRRELTAERLNERFTDDTDLAIDEHLDEQLMIHLNQDDYGAITTLWDSANHIETLVATRLGVTANALNVRPIRSRLQKRTPYRILDGLAKSYIGNIDGRIRFGPGETLEGIATAAYDAHTALDELVENSDPPATDTAVIRALGGTQMAQIESWGNAMEMYAEANPTFTEKVKQFAAFEQSHLDELIEAAELSKREFESSKHRSSGQETMHRHLLDLRIKGDPLIQKLMEVENEWPDTSTAGAGSQFMEVSEYYVE